MKYTGDQVREAMIASDIKYAHARNCSLCDAPLFFRREGDRIFWSGDCDCTTYGSGLQERSWDEIAAWINMQTSPEASRSLCEMFGIKTEPS